MKPNVKRIFDVLSYLLDKNIVSGFIPSSRTKLHISGYVNQYRACVETQSFYRYISMTVYTIAGIDNSGCSIVGDCIAPEEEKRAIDALLKLTKPNASEI